MKTRTVYSFGSFRLDAGAKVLLKNGEPVRLARKAAETLLVLVENSGQVLTKEDLMSALWPDRVVDEANLAQNVAVVRKALGVERGAPGYIETFPGRGYRVLGPVAVTEEPAPGQRHEEPHGGSKPAGPAEGHEPALAAAEETSPARRQSRPPSYTVPILVACTIGAVLAAVWIARQYQPTPRELHRTVVTRLPGREIQPAISPDGTRIAFVSEDEAGRNAGIWIQAGTSDPPRRITPPDGSYTSPAWSPDGQHLACVRFRGPAGSLIVLPATGGSAREAGPVMPPPYGLANRFLDWSPDGDSLVFADAETPHGTLSLYALSFATGARRKLTQPGPDLIGDVAPRFSPDGKTICFVRAFHRSWQELFAVPFSGGAQRQLTSFAGQISGLDWFDSGGSLVFGSDKGGEFRLWTISAAGPGANARPTSIYADFPLQLSISRKTQTLAYSVLYHDFNIWRLDLQAKAGSAPEWTRIIASSAQDVSPQYSPDGRRICFRSDRSGEEQLWVADSDGGNPLQVTQGKLRPSVGRWAPDSRSIVFNNARTGDLYVARESDGTWSTQPLGANGYHPVYSPDARWIYAGTKGIARIPVQGGPASQITPLRGLSLGASSDGSSLYFVREPSGTVLWRLDLASSEAKPVLDGLVPYCTSCWALASAGIYYLGSHPESETRQTLYFRDASGRTRTLVDYPEPLPPIGTGPFSLSPDGRYLLCVRLGPSTGDVVRVDPFP